MKISQDEWTTALTSLKSDGVLGPRLAEITADLGVDLDTLDAPASVDALFDDSGEWELERAARWLLGGMLVTRMKSFKAVAEKVEGDLELDGRRIVLGDLDVSGKIELEDDLIVLGNLNVAKYSRDTFMNVCNLIVTGSITCGQGLFSEGGLYVGGRVSAPLVTLTFNQGFAKILGGATARVLIESDHGGTRIFGPVDAAVVSFDEMRLDDDERDSASAAELLKHLTDDAARVVAGEDAAAGEDDDEDDDDLDVGEVASKLVELVANGEAIFK
jgi:hypothetical protein